MNKFKTKNRDWSSFPLAPISEDCGIYIIRNLINGSCYIGSSKNISKRIRYHLRQKGSVSVAAAINKYGLENFAAYMLQPCPLEFRFKVETFWIELVEPEYNRVVFADGVISYTEESRAKMRKSWETRPPVSEETKRRQSAAHKGRKMSPEAIEKSVSKRRGLKFSEETQFCLWVFHNREQSCFRHSITNQIPLAWRASWRRCCRHGSRRQQSRSRIKTLAKRRFIRFRRSRKSGNQVDKSTTGSLPDELTAIRPCRQHTPARSQLHAGMTNKSAFP